MIFHTSVVSRGYGIWRMIMTVIADSAVNEVQITYLDEDMRRGVPPICGVQISWQTSRFTIGTYVDRVADGAVEPRTHNV